MNLHATQHNPSQSWSRRKKLAIALAIYLFANAFLVFFTVLRDQIGGCDPGVFNRGFELYSLTRRRQDVLNTQTDDHWIVRVDWFLGERQVAARSEKRRPGITSGFSSEPLFGGPTQQWLFTQTSLTGFSSSTYGLPFPFFEVWAKRDIRVHTGWDVYWPGLVANIILFSAAAWASFGIANFRRHWLAHRQSLQGRCQHCGYDLLGLPKGGNEKAVCPECGASIYRTPHIVSS